MKFKKILNVLGISAFLLSGALTSCGGSNNNIKDDLQYDEYGNPIFDNVELNVLSVIGKPDNEYLSRVNTMFNDFYKENGLKANITSVENADFYTQLANMINTDPDNAPDVVIIHSEYLTKLAHDKIIVPMDEYYEALKNNTFKKTDYIENLMNECMYQDKIYGVPLDVHAGVWYVREDILNKNGLKKPTNLNELVSTCNALIEKYNAGELYTRQMNKNNPSACEWTNAKVFGDSYSPIVMSSAGGIENGWIPQTAVFQNGGTLTDDKGKPAWNTQGLKDTMQMFRDWQSGESTLKDTNGKNRFDYKGKFVSDDNDANTVWSKLSKGEAVFSCEGPWRSKSRLDEYNSVLGEKVDADGNKFKPLGIMNMSKLYAFDQTKDYADDIYGVGHCFAITRTVQSKTKRVGAALYSEFMTKNAIQYLEGGHLPACKAILESDQYKEQPFYEEYLKEFGSPENFKMLGNTPYYSQVYEKLKNVYIDTFTESKNNISINDLVDTRYKEALKEIDSLEDL